MDMTASIWAIVSQILVWLAQFQPKQASKLLMEGHVGC